MHETEQCHAPREYVMAFLKLVYVMIGDIKHMMGDINVMADIMMNMIGDINCDEGT